MMRERYIGMSVKFKKAVALVLVVLMAAFAVGCSGDAALLKYKAYSEQPAKSAAVAENENYSLFWDNSQKCVLLSDNRTGKVWSSVPYDYYTLSEKSGTQMVQLCSPLTIEYFEKSSYQVKTAMGYSECVSDGTVVAQKIKNGVKVTYYFERLQISIPVSYVLCENGLQAKLLVDEIAENDNLVISVSLMPYFASAKASDNSYLVVPSGSGALMYTDEGGRNTRTFSGAVYGQDLNHTENEQLSNTEAVRLPFFGVKDNGDALCVILGQGSEIATINAEAGNSEIGYAGIYPSFKIRGYDYVSAQNMHGVSTIVVKYSDYKLDTDCCSVTYIPLNGSDAGFVEMANCYRENATDLSPTADDKSLYLKVLGAVQDEKLVLGVPITVLDPLTTVEQAKDMALELDALTSGGTVVQLAGYGKSGLDIGKVGGGFTLASALGSKKDYKNLESAFAEKGIYAFFDLDVINFSSSGSGYSYSGDSAKTPNRLTLNRYKYFIDVFNKNTDVSFRLLSRSALLSVSDKIIGMSEKYGMSGISLSTLSSSAYSDYSDERYIQKNGMSEDTQKIFASLKSAGLSVVAESANAYAAEVASCIINAPTKADSSDALDVEIPLYQIVYKGYVPLSGSVVNLAADATAAILSSVSTGSGLCYSISAESDAGDNYNNAAYYSDYANVKADIETALGTADAALAAVRGCTITNYEIISKTLRVTEFSNGVKIAVNYSDGDCEWEGTVVPAKSFTVSGVSR